MFVEMSYQKSHERAQVSLKAIQNAAAFSNVVFSLEMSVCQRNLGPYDPRCNGIQSSPKEMQL